MPTRRICILTTTRADYDLLVPLLDEIDGRNDLESLLLVSGTHLSPAFGMTVDAIEAEGRAITARIDIDASTTTDSPAGAAAVMARGLEKFTEVLLDLTPDALVLLGDRFEILAAAAAGLSSWANYRRACSTSAPLPSTTFVGPTSWTVQRLRRISGFRCCRPCF